MYNLACCEELLLWSGGTSNSLCQCLGCSLYLGSRELVLFFLLSVVEKDCGVPDRDVGSVEMEVGVSERFGEQLLLV